jgi:hypothetical protein
MKYLQKIFSYSKNLILEYESIMCNKGNCAIVVPVYRDLNHLEEYALNRLKKLLSGKYDIFLVMPHEIKYHFFCYKLKIKLFSSSHFQNISSYNKLLKSKRFYLRFINYKFILIYQLDALIFDDNLGYWLNLNYSYLGAPIFKEGIFSTQITEIRGMNGGFSLRKVNDALRVLFSLKRVYKTEEIMMKRHNYLKRNSLRYILRYLLYTITNRFILIKYFHKGQEDLFWSKFVVDRFKFYRIADLKTAMKFSFELNSRELFQMNQNKLPFGCHGWNRTDEMYVKEGSFWEDILNKFEK